MLEDLPDAARFDYFSIGKQRNHVRNFSRETHLVRDQNEIAALFTQFFNHVQNFRRHFWIERRSRLVEQQQLRFDGDGPRDGDSLALAAGKFGGLFVRVIFEAETFQKTLREFFRVSS